MSDDIDEIFDRVQIANDQFRRSCMDVDADILWHASIVAEGNEFRTLILKAIREHEDFDYDEFGLHDYGVVFVGAESFDWKIVYWYEDRPAQRPVEATHRFLSVDPEDIGNGSET